MRKQILLITFLYSACSLTAQKLSSRNNASPDSIAVHPVVLDQQSKLSSWMGPPDVAYDMLLRRRWDFVKNRVPASPGPFPRSDYPQYYFYCAFRDSANMILPDTWMNDVGEKIPNWFESARLYYAYTGDDTAMKMVRGLMDYSLAHGFSPSSFSWPEFPYTTTNAGDLEFRGFTSAKRFAIHEIQVDHAAEMGLTLHRLYQFTGDKKYEDAAMKIANTLATKVRTGDASHSPWPYRVIMNTGAITAEYGANWTGAYLLFDNLIQAKVGNVSAYQEARHKIRDFLLDYPMNTGFWTDGHTDTEVNSNTYKSNLSCSNYTLCVFDHPGLDADWKFHVPQLIQWTEENFVFRCAPGEPSNQWGANIVGEQDDFLFKMDYQTARYGAVCARWYGVSGDEAYKERAYRALNWVTYCMDSTGKVFESPLSKGILSWWSDSYGECPRMFYHAMAAIPEWAPRHQNHILYSEGILKNVKYSEDKVEYAATEDAGVEFLRLNFEPAVVTINGNKIRESVKRGYSVKSLGDGDYAVTIKRTGRAGRVVVNGASDAK